MTARSSEYWVGKAIQAIRVALLQRDEDFTQEHVAHEAHVSLRHYQKIEAGMIDVRISTLAQIATVLGKRPQQIYDKADELRTSKRRQ